MVMFDSIDGDLECSFCKMPLIDVVKLVPECGESICGHCYMDLKAKLNDWGEFECRACGEWHSMPKHGLADNRCLLKVLRKRRVEKPLSEPAEMLKRRVQSMPGQLSKLVSFDEREYINQHCDLLEVEVVEEIDSLFKHLSQIQADLLKQIKQYREKCLESLSSSLSQTTNEERETIKQELASLRKDVEEFGAEWNDYFGRVDTFVTDSQVEAALNKAIFIESKIATLSQKQRNCAFGGQIMLFEASHSFFGEQDPLQKLLNLSIQKTTMQIQQTPINTFNAHSDRINQVLFLSDHKLVSCSNDRTIKISDVRDGTSCELKGHVSFVYTVVSLPNGWLASGSAELTIKIWDLDQRKTIRTLQGHKHAVASLKVLKNGNLASYCLDDTIKIWDPYSARNNLLLTISGHGNNYWVISFVVLPNDHLVTFSVDREEKEICILRVWNPIDGQLVKSISTGSAGVPTLLVLFSGQLAVGLRFGTIKVVDLKDKANPQVVRMHAHSGRVYFLAQLSNGNLISCGGDYNYLVLKPTIKVWHLADMTLLQTIDTNHTERVNSLCISPNEEMLASVNSDKSIKLWPIVGK